MPKGGVALTPQISTAAVPTATNSGSRIEWTGRASSVLVR